MTEPDRTHLIANEILRQFAGTGAGHCARVDYLEREEAIAVCKTVADDMNVAPINARILGAGTELAINTDEAIEIRNRKTERLCLFVPADLVDATASSLANSFAVIDGRELHRAALDHLIEQASLPAQRLIQAVFARLRGAWRASDDQRLDFVAAVLARDAAGELEQAGLELWRIGLIADGGGRVAERLERNRKAVGELARPLRLLASTADRIRNIGVDAATLTSLLVFFRGRELNDVRTWSRALVAGDGPTLDRWTFPKEDPSDLESVTITPFVNAEGGVDRVTRLQQPDGPGGSLLARVGAKETLVVRWKSNPPKPRNLSRWRVEVIPADDSSDAGDVDLPAREVPGTRERVTIKLDLELDEPLDFALVVRVTALDSAGEAILNTEGDIVTATSDEFYLVDDPVPGAGTDSGPREARRTVPTIAFGRLQTALEIKDPTLTETQHQFSADQAFFRMKLNQRWLLTIGLTPALLRLQRTALENPRSGGCFILDLDEVQSIDVAAAAVYPLNLGERPPLAAFLKARDTFFGRLKKAHPRDVLEVADWTSELTNAALRYTQSYRELLDELLAATSDPGTLRAALSVDTILVRIQSGHGVEEALVLLPSHPLRATWLASHAQLLRTWETQALDRPAHARKQAIDLDALQALSPTNVPAFAFHADSETAFTFYQNLRFFYGVALPADIPDPQRRFDEIATIFGATTVGMPAGDIQAARLVDHLTHFRELHPYADRLVTTLVNPDRGELFASALLESLRRTSPRTDDGEPTGSMPSFHITAYVEDPGATSLRSLDRIRQFQAEHRGEQLVDHLLPAVSTTLRPMDELDSDAPIDAHLALIADFTRPSVTTIAGDATGAQFGSLAMYGLVMRFVPSLVASDEALTWRHQLITERVGRPEDHPAGPRFSDTLVDAQTAVLRAQGRLLGDHDNVRPALEVVLNPERQRLLEQLHAHTNWVITLDRFFALDYYDSPLEPRLNAMARTYVLDYSPEFAEGLGHRIMVTTAWHDEISMLLGRAMDELGFTAVDQSVSRLLHYLKTVSGRLALQALQGTTTAAAAVGLGVVTAWLQQHGRLRQAVLLPVDLHPRLFSRDGTGAIAAGERRCDLVLIGLKRNIVEATFIEVKWRRGRVPLEELAHEMLQQMESSAEIMRERFFDPERIDGALQRGYLATVLRFYFDRAQRYGLIDTDAAIAFGEHLTRLEKAGLQFRPGHEGYIVSLEAEPRKAFMVETARFTLLTAADFVGNTEFTTTLQPTTHTATPAERDGGSAGEDIAAIDDEITPVDPRNGMQTDDDITEPDLASSGNQLSAEDAPAAPSEEPPNNSTPEAEVSVGLGSAGGQQIDWSPSIKGSPHLFIIGIPGQGKSWTVTRILSELGTQGVPALVLDFHGQFADPNEPVVQRLHPTVWDAAEGLPFSPFECSRLAGAGDWRATSFALSEIFAYVTGLGDMQRDVVYTSIRDAYRARGFGDTDAADLEYPTLEEVLTRIEEREKTQRNVSNVSARCRPLLEMDLFRPTADAPDLMHEVRNGLIIDLHNLYVETLQLAAGAFVLRKLYKDMFSWGQAQRLRLAIVLDEAHRLARDITLPKIMKEGRKFGISVIVASQGMSDFHQDILSNAGTKVIFRTNFPESRKIAGYIRARQGQDLAARIEQLSVGSAYVQTPEMAHGSVVQMYPPTEEQ